MRKHFAFPAVFLSVIAPAILSAQNQSACRDLPSHADVTAALKRVVSTGGNGGLGFQMWATIVNRDGEVCAITFSGGNRGDQWPGSRVISAQKAYTANAFSLPRFALSTANLYSAVQPGGTLFGLPSSNPVDPNRAYAGNAEQFGQPNDPMVGQRVGGVNVFGGGLALYNRAGTLVGAIGLSGDTSCTDHIIAWKVRDALQLDYVPGGVAASGVAPGGTDNILFDISADPGSGRLVSAGGFGHPKCDDTATTVGNQLPTTNPISTRQ